MKCQASERKALIERAHTQGPNRTIPGKIRTKAPKRSSPQRSPTLEFKFRFVLRWVERVRMFTLRETTLPHAINYFCGIVTYLRNSSSELGRCSIGKLFRFVRACVRAVWLPSGIGSKVWLAGLFPFPFWLG